MNITEKDYRQTITLAHYDEKQYSNALANATRRLIG